MRQDEVPAQAGKRYRQSFHGKNLMECLSRFGGDDIEFVIAEANHPSFIRCSSDPLTTMMLGAVFAHAERRRYCSMTHPMTPAEAKALVPKIEDALERWVTSRRPTTRPRARPAFACTTR